MKSDWILQKNTVFLNYLFILIFFSISFSYGQTHYKGQKQDQNICNGVIKGYVYDKVSGIPLEDVLLCVIENQMCVNTNSEGAFMIHDVCERDYHIRVSHLACVTQEEHLTLNSPLTQVKFFLEHGSHELEEIRVLRKLKTDAPSLQHKEQIKHQQIQDQAGKELALQLEQLTGVSVLKTGSGISKPIVHGMYGNRLSIINNGIEQAGQQWGNDHGPEIDPLQSNTLTVLKGVSALAYTNNGMGGAVLSDSEPIDDSSNNHLHGNATYFYQTNGRKHGIHAKLEQYNKTLAWRIQGTYQNSGDQYTPDYYLMNTASKNYNFSTQLEKKWSEKYQSKLYASSFNNEIGILRGSHIGNLTDLQIALTRQEPFFTEEEFSRDIQEPRQEVQHYLLKLENTYEYNSRKKFQLSLAAQNNQRREYDIRRGNRSDIPALALAQQKYSIFAKYDYRYKQHYISVGSQNNIINNNNDIQTGILPLIPNYASTHSGLFTTYRLQTPTYHQFEIGGRWDVNYQDIARAARNNEIQYYERFFTNQSYLMGWTYKRIEKVSLSTYLGYNTRFPAINELFSFGLHQGIAAIEEGNPDLRNEKGLKFSISTQSKLTSWLSMECVGYLQSIEDYIFLNPQGTRLTIRGAFPVFNYKQADTRITGLDFSSHIDITPNWHFELKASWLQGDNLSENIPLVYMPNNNVLSTLKYTVSNLKKVGNVQISNISVSATATHVFKQNHLEDWQDFSPVPDAYTLLNSQASFEFYYSKLRIRNTLSMDNMLNMNYRSYLNRQRYFADDLGRNIRLSISVFF